MRVTRSRTCRTRVTIFSCAWRGPSASQSRRFIAVVQIPRVYAATGPAAPRPRKTSSHYVLIQNLIQAHVHDLFPGLEVEQVYGFRLTRNSDLYIDEEEAENLLRTIEDELRKRARGNAVPARDRAGLPARHVRRAPQHLQADGGRQSISSTARSISCTSCRWRRSTPSLPCGTSPYIPIVSPSIPAGK